MAGRVEIELAAARRTAAPRAEPKSAASTDVVARKAVNGRLSLGGEAVRRAVRELGEQQTQNLPVLQAVRAERGADA